jgi:anti-anti-sigma factor
MLEIIPSSSSEFVHIRLRGQITSATAPEFEQALNGVLKDQKAPQCVLDLAELSYTSSAGLRVLLVLAKRIRNAGGRLVLCGAQPTVLHVFEAAGFTQIFTIVPDLKTAREKLVPA